MKAPSTARVYIILNYAWEYNDDYLYQPEESPYFIQKDETFTSKAAAEARCAELNKKRRAECDYEQDFAQDWHEAAGITSIDDIEFYEVVELQVTGPLELTDDPHNQ